MMAGNMSPSAKLAFGVPSAIDHYSLIYNGFLADTFIAFLFPSISEVCFFDA
jgi:hypothetical protein